jgi:hypothetical protein
LYTLTQDAAYFTINTNGLISLASSLPVATILTATVSVSNHGHHSKENFFTRKHTHTHTHTHNHNHQSTVNHTGNS